MGATGESGHSRGVQPSFAEEICDQIRTAKEVHDLARHATGLAQQTVSRIIGKTFAAQAGIRVVLSEETKAHVTYDDEVVDEAPREFVATELGSIGTHQVEFYNRSNEHRLVIPVAEDFDVEPSEQQPS